ncbi:MAG: hypothetical protein ABF449_05340 [Ethanoligenens sp.]
MLIIVVAMNEMLPVATCAFIALLLSDVLKIEPIYGSLLERSVEKKGHSLPMQEKGGLRGKCVKKETPLAIKQAANYVIPSI